MSNKTSRRLFFALWPDSLMQQKIFLSFEHSSKFQTSENLSQGTSAQRKPKIYKPENLHITLHYLGNISLNDMECVDKMAKTITARPFTLKLNCYGQFHAARVFWMGTDKLPDDLLYLHAELEKRIALCSLHLDTRPYVPHITLMRNAPQEWGAVNTETILWKVERFALVESLPGAEGVNYIPLRFYDLTAG